MAWYTEMLGELEADGIHLDDKAMRQLDKYTGMSQFIRGGLNAMTKIGSMISLPSGEGEERRISLEQTLKRLGVPDSPDGYNLSVPADYPEAIRPDDDALARFKKRMLDSNALPEQAERQFKEILAMNLEEHTRAVEEKKQADEKAMKEASENRLKFKETLSEKLGDKLNPHIQSIRLVMDKYGLAEEGLFDSNNQPTDKFYDLGEKRLESLGKIAQDTVRESGFVPGGIGADRKEGSIDYSVKYPNSGFKADGTL